MVKFIKNLKKFFLSEEGRISKHSIMKIGAICLASAGAITANSSFINAECNIATALGGKSGFQQWRTTPFCGNTGNIMTLGNGQFQFGHHYEERGHDWGWAMYRVSKSGCSGAVSGATTANSHLNGCFAWITHSSADKGKSVCDATYAATSAAGSWHLNNFSVDPAVGNMVTARHANSSGACATVSESVPCHKNGHGDTNCA